MNQEAAAIVRGTLPPSFGRAGIVALRDDRQQILGGTWRADGDRLLIDLQGEPIPADALTALFSRLENS